MACNRLHAYDAPRGTPAASRASGKPPREPGGEPRFTLVANALKFLPHEAGPRQAADHESQRAGRKPDASAACRLLQNGLPRSVARGTSAARKRRSRSRPPQRDTRPDHHERPARDVFHEQFARLAEQEPAVNHPVHLHEAGVDAQRAEHRAIVGIQIDALLVAARPRRNTNSALRSGSDVMCAVIAFAPSGIAATRLREQDVLAQARRGLRGDDQSMRIKQGLDLRLEAVDRAGQREHDQERHHEEAGIEMPAPKAFDSRALPRSSSWAPNAGVVAVNIPCPRVASEAGLRQERRGPDKGDRRH